MRLGARYLVLPLILVCGSANALEVTCDYSDRTVVKTVGKIEKTRNFRKETADYAEEKRVCAVKFDAKIGNNWVETHDFYVFGPEMSENNACDKAKEKAKVKALVQFAAQNVTSIQEEICDETVEVKDNIVEEKVIREVVYVDKETGQEVRRNEVSGSFSCLLLNIFSPTEYHNPRCDSFN